MDGVSPTNEAPQRTNNRRPWVAIAITVTLLATAGIVLFTSRNSSDTTTRDQQSQAHPGQQNQGAGQNTSQATTAPSPTQTRVAIPDVDLQSAADKLATIWHTPINRAAEGNRQFEATIQRPDGAKLWILMTATKAGGNLPETIKCMLLKPNLTVTQQVLDEVEPCLALVNTGPDKDQILTRIRTSAMSLKPPIILTEMLPRFSVGFEYGLEDGFALVVVGPGKVVRGTMVEHT